MPAPVVMSASRTYPVTVEDAFDAVLPYPFEQLFTRWHGPIPPISSSDGPTPWGAVGQSRVIRLKGGGSMREQLTVVNRPKRFGYTLTDVTGPMSPIAASIDGTWSFDAAGTGTRIAWSWTVHPKTSVGAAALPVFARLWRGYAAKALQRIEELLVP